MWIITLPWHFENTKLTTDQENIQKMMKSCSRSAAAGGMFTLCRLRENLNLACTVSFFLCNLYAIVNCAKRYLSQK